MNFKYLKSLIPAASFVLALSMASCTSELDISPINPQINTEFSQDEVFAKLYATMGLTGQKGPDGSGDVAGIDEGTSAFFRLIFTMNEYASDEAICGWTDPGVPELGSMSWNSSNGQIEGLYGRLTFDVTLCNHFLEQTKGMSDDKTVRQRAEARFIRALNYYYLMDFYGNVPFTEEVSDELPQQIQRAKLFEYIDGELDAIENDMYEPTEAPFGRADKAANWMLRARMYLNAEVYTGTPRWGDAVTYADKVMKSGYGLCDNYPELFMADNDENPETLKEIILPIRQDGVKTRSWGGSLYLIAATHANGMPSWGTSEQWAGVRARKALVDKFFENRGLVAPVGVGQEEMIAVAKDDRALFYSGGNITDDKGTKDQDRTLEVESKTTFTSGFSVVKWNNLRSDGEAAHNPQYVDTDIPLFRLAEAYLIFAEATLRNGGVEQDALDAVNDLRLRANAQELQMINLDLILDEKAREFYFEGQRRTDLIRYGYYTSNKYLWDWKGGAAKGTAVSSIYNLLPIPASDINANSNLKQNPGY